MLQQLVSSFVQAWLLALVALLIGRYVGQQSKRLPSSFGASLLVYLKVWAATFIAQVLFSAIGLQLGLKEHLQSGFAEFLLPILAGAFAAHQLLLQSHTSSH